MFQECRDINPAWSHSAHVKLARRYGLWSLRSSLGTALSAPVEQAKELTMKWQTDLLNPSHNEMANTVFNVLQSNQLIASPQMRVSKTVSCHNFSVLQKSRRYQAQLFLRIGLSLFTGELLRKHHHLQQLFDGSTQAAKVPKFSRNVSMKRLSNAASRLPDMMHIEASLHASDARPYLLVVRHSCCKSGN